MALSVPNLLLFKRGSSFSLTPRGLYSSIVDSPCFSDKWKKGVGVGDTVGVCPIHLTSHPYLNYVFPEYQLNSTFDSPLSPLL